MPLNPAWHKGRDAGRRISNDGKIEVVYRYVEWRMRHALDRRLALYHRVPEARLLEGDSRSHRLALFPRDEPDDMKPLRGLLVRSLRGWVPGLQPVEIVERKGLG